MKRFPMWRLLGLAALLVGISGCDAIPHTEPSPTQDALAQAIEISKRYFVESTVPKYDQRCLELAAYPATAGPATACIEQMKKLTGIAAELLPLDGKLDASQPSIDYDLREIFTNVTEMRKIKLDSCTSSPSLCSTGLAKFKLLKMRMDFQMISIRQ